MWQNYQNRKRFLYGKDDHARAHEAASTCPDFKEDSEMECISDEPLSCYNCRYRRWTRESFDCMKGANG